MPPLRRKLATGFCGAVIGCLILFDAVRGGIPDEFVKLQAETHGQTIFKNPFGELAGFETLPRAGWIGKDWGKK